MSVCVICSELSLQGGKQIIMLKQDLMYESNYPSNKKRSYIQDNYLPTAERTTYPLTEFSGYRPDQRTPTRISASSRSQRLSEAHRSINQAIEMASAKKQLNQEAIEEVRNVNQEIIGSLSSFCPSKSQHYEPARNRTADRTRDDYSRDYVATSQFDWGQPHEEELRRSQRESVLTSQNVELKGRLNEEIRKNNDLMRYVKKLENENAALRNSGQTGAGLYEENTTLRSQLQGGVPYEILEELRKLKEQNQLLRRDTITLLKKAGH